MYIEKSEMWKSNALWCIILQNKLILKFQQKPLAISSYNYEFVMFLYTFIIFIMDMRQDLQCL